MSDYTLKAEIGGDDSGLQAALSNAMKGLEQWGFNAEKMTEEGSKLFKSVGIDVDKFAEKLGTSAPMLLGLAAAGLAIGEIGKEIFEVGKQFDEAFSVIGKGTGEVGPQLQALGDSFVSLIGSGVEQNINDLAGAFTLLAQKTGLAGPELEELTKKYAEFATVTGQNVKQAIEEVTTVLERWGLDVQKAPELMDQLTLAWQKTGTPISDMTQALTRNGATFQALGISLTEATAMMAEFGKEGVNSRQLVGGLNTALATLSKEGGDVQAAFVDAQNKIKSFATTSDAAAYAATVFGKQAGPSLALAIRNGGDAISVLTKQLTEAEGTVERTAKATQDFNEKWAALTNKITADVAPIGEVFVNIGKILEDLFSFVVDDIENVVGPLFKGLQGIFRDVGASAQSMAGLVKDVIAGDWKNAWIQAQLVVLNFAKIILDALSGVVNFFLSAINNMIEAIKKFGESVGAGELVKGLKAINVNLAEMTGLSGQIDKLFKSLTDGTNKAAVSTQNLGKVQKKESDDFIHASSEAAKYYLIGLTAMEAEQAKFAALIDSTTKTMIDGPFTALGVALEQGQNGWEAFGKAAVHSLGTIVKGLGDQMTAKAALDFAQAVAYSSNPFTAPAAPGYYAQASIEAGAAVAAYTAAGALSAFERGTAYSAAGYAVVGERGPEVVKLPQGAAVLNQQQTSGVTGERSVTLNMNIGQIKRDSVGAVMREVKSVARQLAFGGVL